MKLMKLRGIVKCCPVGLDLASLNPVIRATRRQPRCWERCGRTWVAFRTRELRPSQHLHSGSDKGPGARLDPVVPRDSRRGQCSTARPPVLDEFYRLLGCLRQTPSRHFSQSRRLAPTNRCGALIHLFRVTQNRLYLTLRHCLL